MTTAIHRCEQHTSVCIYVCVCVCVCVCLSVCVNVLGHLVSSPAEMVLSVISIFSCSVSVWNIMFTRPNIHLASNCNNPVRCCAPHRDVIWSSSVCLERWEETETESRRTVETLRETCKAPEKPLKSTEDKRFTWHTAAQDRSNWLQTIVNSGHVWTVYCISRVHLQK